MNRRKFLQDIGGVVSGSTALTLAGCVSNSDGGTPTETYPEIPSFDATRGGFYTEIEPIEKAIREAINEFRIEEGYSRVGPNNDLSKISRNHSRNMAKEGFFDHIDHEGRSPSARADYFGYPDASIAENLYWTQIPPEGYTHEVVGARTVSSWKDSSSHLMTMLWTGAVVVGVGAYVAESGAMFVTAMFANVDSRITS